MASVAGREAPKGALTLKIKDEDMDKVLDKWRVEVIETIGIDGYTCIDGYTD